MAISNHRITAFDGEHVSFRWRDYRHGGKQRVMPLDAVEFLRRFFLHVLPRGFVRIRHYGLLSNRFRKQLLPLARTLLAAQGREPTASAATRLRSLALSPLRRTYARRRALHRRTTLFRRLRFFMTVAANPLCRFAPCTRSQSCVHLIRQRFKATSNRHSRNAEIEDQRYATAQLFPAPAATMTD